jgi:hypothetical protein
MPARARGMTTVPGVLFHAHQRMVSSVYSDRTALYLVRLTDVDGLALAVAVQQRIGGPDPAILLERAQGMGVPAPLMTASAPVEALVQVLEELDVLKEADRQLLGGLWMSVTMMFEGVGITFLEGRRAAEKRVVEGFAPDNRRWTATALGPARCSTSALPPKRGSTDVRASKKKILDITIQARLQSRGSSCSPVTGSPAWSDASGEFAMCCAARE